MPLNPTPLLRPYFAALRRRRAQMSSAAGIEAVQRRVLCRLLHRARNTEVGRSAAFGRIHTPAEYASALPVVQYEDIRPAAMRMVYGERDVLWPGRTTHFAQSSGTSGAPSKYIPVTADSLRCNHYAGAAQAVASYLGINPRSRLFAGRSFILGGSYANALPALPAGVRVGDLSATLIDCVNPAVELLRIPDRKTALMSDWTDKLPALVRASAASKAITNISGVPSWFLTVLRGVLEYTGAANIHQVWPGLEVFFHGGISFAPYRRQYEAITDPARMQYIENYNASEGFFAVQDLADASAGMLLLLDAGVYYEFIPLAALDDADGGASKALTAWQVVQGGTYALVISACNGLWRYMIGDTVTIRSVAPLRISIAGRTGAYINAFGEELMVWNTDTALQRACAATAAGISDYTVAPVYSEGGSKGRHQWLIEWNREPSGGIDAFAGLLDAELQALNSDYAAKRAGNIFLDRLEIVTLPPGSFDRWLAATGKRGGQRKVPRLANDRTVADSILTITKTQSI